MTLLSKRMLSKFGTEQRETVIELYGNRLDLICSSYNSPVRTGRRPAAWVRQGAREEKRSVEMCQLLLPRLWGCVCGRTAFSPVVEPVCLVVSSRLDSPEEPTRTRRNSEN